MHSLPDRRATSLERTDAPIQRYAVTHPRFPLPMMRW